MSEFLAFILWWFVTKVLDNYIKDIREENNKANEHDKLLFLKIRNEIIKKEEMEFLRDWNPRSNFRLEKISWLLRVEDSNIADDPDLKFIEKALEEKKLRLFRHVEQTIQYITSETFYHPKIDWYQHVPPEWEITQFMRYEKVIQDLIDLSKRTWDEYEYFLDYGRKKFKI